MGAKVNVGIEKEIRDKLQDYCKNTRPRVLIADAVTVAVEKWLDTQPKK